MQNDISHEILGNPKVLYKYVSLDIGELILAKKTLKISLPSEFNDVFEGSHIIDHSDDNVLNTIGQRVYFIETDPLTDAPLFGYEEAMREWLHKSIKKYPGFQPESIEMIEKMPAVNYQPFREGFFGSIEPCIPRILCLSDSPTSKLMWDHYADGHKGICIGLNTGNNFFQTPYFYRLRRVEYQPVSTKMPIEVAVWRKWLIKNMDYAYESEWRALFYENNLEQCTLKNGSQITVARFQNDAIHSIIFGSRVDPQRMKAIRELLQPNVKTFRSIPDFNTHSVRFEAE